MRPSCGKYIAYHAPPALPPEPSLAPVYARIVGRGFAMVTLVSSNTVFLSRGQVWQAAMGGALISMVWWQNSSKHRPDVPYGWLAYGCGAGLGTLAGAMLAWWI